MIHSFKCDNFFSIKDSVTMDFTSSSAKVKAAPEGFVQSRVLEDVYLSKVNALFGPNASGKTNILRVLRFVSWLITGSFGSKADQNLPYLIYFGDKFVADTSLEVIFEHNKRLYKYFVKLTAGLKENGYIRSEQISEFNTRTNQFNSLYKRNKTKKGSEYQLVDSDFSAEVPREAMSRDNSSFLSIAAQFGHTKSKEIVSYWESIARSTNVDLIGGYFEEVHHQKLFEISKCLFENQDVKKKVTEVLNRMDVGLSDISIDENIHTEKSIDGLSRDKEVKFYRTFFHRKSKTSESSLSIPDLIESTGVKSLFSQITRVLLHLKSEAPSMIVLDEIDSGVHPELIPVFFDLFRDEEMNPYGHQLLVTLHSLDVMDDLEKSQIFLTELYDLKTNVYSLASVPNVRKDISYSASYKAGRFGARPTV